MVIRLNRDLRKVILQGHPWVYRQALALGSESSQTACLALLKDSKNKFLAWGYYDPHSPLAFRVINLKDQRPDHKTWEQRINEAVIKRKSIFRPFHTNAFRLINGEGDLLPGLVCDIYNDCAVLQLDGQGAIEFWTEPERLEACLKFIRLALKELLNIELQSIALKERGASGDLKVFYGAKVPEVVEILENGIKFNVRILEGQKTGFFLDQRDNRDYIKSLSKDKNVLNLFSYTGGFSLYAGVGGAAKVTSVDISQGATSQSEENWQINDLEAERHNAVAADVFKFLEESSSQNQNQNQNQKWDMIIVDPPSMTHSEKQKAQAVKKYTEAFMVAAKQVKNGGDLVLSSCSSHISFDDFFEIIKEALSKSRKRGQILKVSGQGSDHPFLHISHELRYLKFVHLVLHS